MQQYLQNKKGLVQNVFDKVYNQYDLMNDFMSLGIHRIWKKNLLNMMNPHNNQNLIDVACGTGDIAKLFLNLVNKSSHITCVDPNKGMIQKGKEKLKDFKNLNVKDIGFDSNDDKYEIIIKITDTKPLSSIKEKIKKFLSKKIKNNGFSEILINIDIDP